LCLLLVILSAITAESSDSIPAKTAIVMASGKTALILSNENSGKVGKGREDGIAPKRLSIVSTGI